MLHVNERQKPCWILSYPRTGSNFLADGLNWTGKFYPEFKEWINPPDKHNRNHQQTKVQAWKKIPFDEIEYHTNVDKLIKYLPRNLKVHSFDYYLYFTDEHKPKIEQRLKDIRYILIRRHDLIATAVSFYIANNTHVFYAETPEEVEQQKNIQVKIDEEELLDAYQEAISWDVEWNSFLENTKYLEVFYEDLTTNPDVLKNVYEYLELDTSKVYRNYKNIPSQKLQHPQTPELTNLLKSII